MRLHRFFVPESLDGEELYLQDEQLVHQLTKVFRMHAGERIVLFNGDGFDHTFEITTLSKNFLRARPEGARTVAWVPEKKITLCLANIRKERFEWALEKCTELGVSHIIPLETERTERGAVKPDRARKIMQEAAEQCGRGDIPTFGESKTIKEICAASDHVYIGDISGMPVRKVSEGGQQSVTLLIGPEGGWSEKELLFFDQANVQKISLGPTMLRAETAAVVAVTHFID
jgi:16S rRNA (uracil1498-N3)-methyltransferase